MRLTFTLILFILSSTLLSSCKKVEGPGGKFSIIGKLHAQVFDGAGNMINNYELADHDVYIIYGDDDTDTFHDDDVKSSYDGTFRFDYLEEGNYRIFVYEKCPTCPSGEKVLIYNVELSKKNSPYGGVSVADASPENPGQVDDHTVTLGTINVRQNP